MRDVFIKALEEIATEDDRLMLIAGDLGYGVFDEFRRMHPFNFLNAGVSEQNMTSIATGMSLEGHIVYTYSIGNFSTFRCLEQIRNDACYHDANVKIVSVGGGFSYGPLGISHHATEDLAVMRSIPNLTVISPCGLWEAYNATKAIHNCEGTCYLRLDKSFGNDEPIDSREEYKVGRARVIRKGSDISLFVTGGILEEVDNVAKILELKGISVQIISIHTLKPIDEKAIIDSAIKTALVATIEEHTIHGGLGSAISEVIMDNGLQIQGFVRIGLEAGFSSIVGSQKYLRKRYNLSSEIIANKLISFIDKN